MLFYILIFYTYRHANNNLLHKCEIIIKHASNKLIFNEILLITKNIHKHLNWKFFSTNFTVRVLRERLFCHRRTNRRGCRFGWNVIPGNPSKSGSEVSDAGRTWNVCMMDTKYWNSSISATVFPGHTRFPVQERKVEG